MTVRIDQFGGIAPRQHPTLLADGMATTAMNVKLESGKLVPLREPSEAMAAGTHLEGNLRKAGDAKSIHVWRRADGSAFDFLCFPGVTWAARGNVADDGYTRLLVSGDFTGNGKVNAPRLYLRTGGKALYVGIRKATPPNVIVYRYGSQGASEYGPPASGNVRYTRFFITWVDEYRMESPVSAPSLHRTSDSGTRSEELAYLDGETIYFEIEKTDANDKKIAEASSFRIYKVITGSSEGRVQYVTSITKAEATQNTVTHNSGARTFYRFTLTINDASTGEEIAQIENAPSDLTCIQAVPGGYYCGFSPSEPKTVCFSDVNLLYSWPTTCRYDVEDNIVALAVTSNTVFVLTDGWPYALSGTAPESMSVAKLASPAACVSPHGVCVFKNAVFYASNSGLMAIANSASEGTVAQNVTEQMFTSDQWRALSPETCLLGHHKGRLYACFPDAADRNMRGLTFNFSEGLSVAVTQHEETAKCFAVDNAKDEMYFTREESEGEEA